MLCIIVKKIHESTYNVPVVKTTKNTQVENVKIKVSLKCLDSERFMHTRT